MFPGVIISSLKKAHFTPHFPGCCSWCPRDACCVNCCAGGNPGRDELSLPTPQQYLQKLQRSSLHMVAQESSGVCREFQRTMMERIAFQLPESVCSVLDSPTYGCPQVHCSSVLTLGSVVDSFVALHPLRGYVFFCCCLEIW